MSVAEVCAVVSVRAASILYPAVESKFNIANRVYVGGVYAVRYSRERFDKLPNTLTGANRRFAFQFSIHKIHVVVSHRSPVAQFGTLGFMSFLQTLTGLFRRSPHSELQVPSGAFKFTGEPTGDVDILKDVLRSGLRPDSGIRSAYLSLVRYDGAQNVRIALCIDTASEPEAAIRPLSEHCAQYISSIDIMFFSDLKQHHIDQLKSVVEPFYEGRKA